VPSRESDNHTATTFAPLTRISAQHPEIAGKAAHLKKALMISDFRREG
jgi:hypothetical protein